MMGEPVMLATKPNDLSVICKYHMTEVECQLQFVLFYIYFNTAHELRTNIHRNIDIKM